MELGIAAVSSCSVRAALKYNKENTSNNFKYLLYLQILVNIYAFLGVLPRKFKYFTEISLRKS